jgi:hypothetical protein
VVICSYRTADYNANPGTSLIITTTITIMITKEATQWRVNAKTLQVENLLDRGVARTLDKF